MDKKWDTVIPADLKRLFVSGTYTYVPLVTKGLIFLVIFYIPLFLCIIYQFSRGERGPSNVS